MSWTDAESPWRRTQARRVRMQFVSLLVIGLITVVLIAGLVSIVRPMLLDLADSGPRSGRSFRTLTLLALAIPVAVFLLSGVMIIRRFRIERQILHRIPELNGAMCPKCRRPLTDETDDASCPRCGRVGSAAEVRFFWEAYPSEASMSHLRRRHPVAVRGKTSLPGSGVPRFIQAIQRRPAYIVLLLAGIWILAGFMMSWFTGGSVLVNMMRVSGGS